MPHDVQVDKCDEQVQFKSQWSLSQDDTQGSTSICHVSSEYLVHA